MLSIRRLLLPALVVALASALIGPIMCAPDGARADSPATSTISGRVLGQTADGGVVPVADGRLVLTARGTGPAVAAPLDYRADGTYTFSGLVPGTYTVRVELRYPTIYVRPVQTVVVVSTPDSASVASDLVLALAGTLSGTVSTRIDGVLTPLDTAHILVLVKDATTGEFRRHDEVWSNWPGTWSVGRLPAGTYRLKFEDANRTPRNHDIVYWPSAPRFSEAVDLVITPGKSFTGLDVVLPDRSLASHRLAGADRFATSAASLSSDWGFPDVAGVTPEVPVLYVASGRDFPDALSAGPAAARQKGALLLVDRDSIPTVVFDEILRLSPDHVVVVGGEAAISDSVFRTLESMQPSIERVAGADRYETSRLVAREAFTDGAARVYFATGASFPDALSAGPAAARHGGPVVLVRGMGGGADMATRELLVALGAPPAIIVGGLEVVDRGVENSLIEISRSGARISGPDRFATSVALSAELPASETAFVASGRGFADALVAGAAAARSGAPLYLSEQSCVPEGVRRAVLDGEALDVVLVGGTASLGTGVEGLSTRCG